MWLSRVIMSHGDWLDETSAVSSATSRWHNTEQSAGANRTWASAHHANVDLTRLTRTMPGHSGTTMSRRVRSLSISERRRFSFQCVHGLPRRGDAISFVLKVNIENESMSLLVRLNSCNQVKPTPVLRGSWVKQVPAPSIMSQKTDLHLLKCNQKL